MFYWAGWASIRALAEEQPLAAPLAVARPRLVVRQTIAGTPLHNFLALHDALPAALNALAPAEACSGHPPRM